MSIPYVSIITPSFNRDKFVAQTLDSLLAQTYDNWENIIVDDGSSDRTKDIVNEYAAQDPRIKLYQRTRDPKGACTCRNEGVDLCKGEYLIFLDTDDLLEPFCIEQRVKAMEENPELDFAIFPSLMFLHQPNDLGLWWNIDKPIDELTRQFRLDVICQGTGVIWRKSAFIDVGYWDETLDMWQDVDLFFRAYINGYRYKKFFKLLPDLHIRRLESSLSRSGYYSEQKVLSRLKVIKQAVNLLLESNNTQYLKEAKYITASCVCDSIRIRKQRLGLNVLKWGLEVGVFSTPEYWRLQVLAFALIGHLDRLDVGRKLIERTMKCFQAEYTVSTLSYPAVDCSI